MPRGDFNMVRFLVERRWATRLTSGMHDFSKFISENAMLNQKLLQRPLSDHFPILLDYKGINKGKSSSKFKGNIMIGASREKKLSMVKLKYLFMKYIYDLILLSPSLSVARLLDFLDSLCFH